MWQFYSGLGVGEGGIHPRLSSPFKREGFPWRFLVIL